ncbi:DNA-binding response regulator, NarL/FixJ family, contains REC and HTH domains [Flagellimonas taeanensis]|uniref:DNA-binding response regulator, NarL/FixJ family, contains REC and HTH domains n=1 Tax=Flagellimonas taeanensis TaxID=1005926 RepID=A0A1M7BZR8_9FLAO|nr:response regulator transcription factor [Allomuricauda taeanensis]MEE1964012.1 response regulator transcription factor [Allomuricauda taeanensis]SFC51113.1 DNA-binding response regulator, NarL/FixJ family, contains REC and HTH domains [Allomuricauda taeanensis]SHL60495.1 DNA-binding response regulator, NarL/FixJ family, contains REC and HTH domains [Allomuricauda taeanensis]
MKTLRILAIDDHEMTMLGYKFILENIDFEGYDIIVDTANTYEGGKKLIEDSVNSFKYDILLLDVQLFAPNENQPHSGEDLGILARKLVPESKIAFMSSFSDNFRINSILKSVDPDGYLVKTDIDPKTLEDAVKTIVLNPPYYSSKALTAIRKKMANDIDLDEKDKQILYHLSMGTKNKDLEKHIRLSPSSIENRKRHLKTLFGTENENDMALIIAAKNRGFI